jgi:phosphoesterase RecJ-like protein
MSKSYQEFKDLVEQSKNILIIQGDNPDGDSLASSLALEQILHDLGKNPHMFCGISIPAHLKYLPGWDRVENKVPKDFDMSIVVDCSSKSLLETSDKSGELSWIASKPVVIIDHHDVENTIDFAKLVYNDITAVSTGEVIFDIAEELKWKLDINALNMIAISILNDSLGLMSQATTAKSIRTIAEVVERGVNLPEIDNARRELMRKSPELVRYKGELLNRIEYSEGNLVATAVIPWDEIEKYSHQYNPSMLVLDDMRLTEGTAIAIAFKTYPGGRVTGKIRANYGSAVANKLAEHFGGGGHPYAAGFKVASTPDFNKLKAECIELATELIKKSKESMK